MSFTSRKTHRSRLSFEGVQSMTEQSHRDQCDIHSILSRYKRSQLLDHVSKYEGQYMELPTAPDFQDAMNAVANAQSMFETIPSDIRQKFGNDPAAFLGFIQDEKNREKITEMGFSTDHLPELKSDTSGSENISLPKTKKTAPDGGISSREISPSGATPEATPKTEK